MLFGGQNQEFKDVKSGVVLMCLGGSHNFLEDKFEMLCLDHFSNTTMIQADEEAKQVLILGKHAVHKLDYKDALDRHFSIAF